MMVEIHSLPNPVQSANQLTRMIDAFMDLAEDILQAEREGKQGLKTDDQGGVTLWLV